MGRDTEFQLARRRPPCRHPLWMYVAAGFVDSFLGVFGTK